MIKDFLGSGGKIKINFRWYYINNKNMILNIIYELKHDPKSILKIATFKKKKKNFKN